MRYVVGFGTCLTAVAGLAVVVWLSDYPASEPVRIALPTPVSKPYGWLDEPVPGPVKGKTAIRGWALDDAGEVSKVEILVDGSPVAATVHRETRAGVCAKYPARAGCPDVGFAGEVDFALIPKGKRWLSLRLTSSRGEVAVLARRMILVEESSSRDVEIRGSNWKDNN